MNTFATLPLHELAKRTAVMVGVAAFIYAVLLFLWNIIEILLLIFAGILVAVLLRTAADALEEVVPVGPRASLAIVCLLILGLLVGSGFLLAPQLREQVAEMEEAVPAALEQARDWLSQYGWGQRIVQTMPDPRQALGGAGNWLTQAAGAVTTVVGALARFFIVLFVGLYIAGEPRLYKKGLLYLFPPKTRKRAHEVFQATGYTLRWWLLGQMMAMTAVGLMTGIGLWILGVPMALALAVIAALLEFIPNIGPILAMVPAVLIAATVDPMTALWVLVLYTAVQQIESYAITPLVQRRVVELPPAVTITFQVLMGLLVGVIGLILATPMAAAALVIIKMVYVQDTLDDDIEVTAAEEAAKEESEKKEEKQAQLRETQKAKSKKEKEEKERKKEETDPEEILPPARGEEESEEKDAKSGKKNGKREDAA